MNGKMALSVELAKALSGYVIIIALILALFPKMGIDLAVKLANGLVPLFFFVLGAIVFESGFWILFKIKEHSRGEEKRVM